MERSFGILLPVSSLPSDYGIGTLGEEAYKFIDFLKKSGASYWQVLPLGPTSYGDSPYQSFSSFAGNPYFIDLQMLIKDGLLTKNDVDSVKWGDFADKVDYGTIYNNRFVVLEKAYEKGKVLFESEFSLFCSENARWLENYSLFMALKRHFGMKSHLEWDDEDIRLRKPAAVQKYSASLSNDISFFSFIQFLFFRQWDKLKTYANENGIKIIGDIPIYVALDSADVWGEPQMFQLNSDNIPTAVSGVPPDAFSSEGQLWGNPLYDWDKMKSDGYGWWIRRIEGATRLYDCIRIDHFRGFQDYWAIPYGETSAINGKWVKGPGIPFVKMLTEWFYGTTFIAEDLGILTEDVREMLRESGLPGMKILEFAFDAETPSTYLPHNYTKNCVCYVGTHDNDTALGWISCAPPEDISFMKEYLCTAEKLNSALIKCGMRSTADLFVIQMQDLLNIGTEGRINVPGTDMGNWTWRMKKNMLTDKLAKKIKRDAKIYGRA